MNISSDLEEAMTEVRRKLVLLQIKSSVLEKYYNLHHNVHLSKNVHLQWYNFMVLLGSEHLSSGSEHHACRASVIYSEHQGTSTQMVVTGFDITLQRSSEYTRLG